MDQAPSHVETLMHGLPTVESVRQLESQLLQLPQIDLQTTHLVHGGLSARTIFIPAGTVLTGALTNFDNVCIVAGDITVSTDDGPQRLTGYHVLTAKAGAKRAGMAHADTYWTTLHRTDLTNIADIEDEMTGESELLVTRRMLALEEDRRDYARFLDEYGFTQELVDHAMACMQPLEVPMPAGFDGLELRPSMLHGLGMFATRAATAGDLLAPVVVDGHRAPPARYTNHSANPNARFALQPDGNVHLIALRDLAANEEVTIDYRQAGREQGYA